MTDAGIMPDRPGATPGRTVWIEIDESELAEVRAALHNRLEALTEWGHEWDAGVAEGQAVHVRAVLARIPSAAAMRRHYP